MACRLTRSALFGHLRYKQTGSVCHSDLMKRDERPTTMHGTYFYHRIGTAAATTATSTTSVGAATIATISVAPSSSCRRRGTGPSVPAMATTVPWQQASPGQQWPQQMQRQQNATWTTVADSSGANSSNGPFVVGTTHAVWSTQLGPGDASIQTGYDPGRANTIAFPVPFQLVAVCNAFSTKRRKAIAARMRGPPQTGSLRS